MLLNGHFQVVGAAVVQKIDTLAYTPEWRAAKLKAIGIALRNAIGKADAHVMHAKIAKRLEGHIALGRNKTRLRCGLARNVTGLAADVHEHLQSSVHRCSRRAGR